MKLKIELTLKAGASTGEICVESDSWEFIKTKANK